MSSNDEVQSPSEGPASNEAQAPTAPPTSNARQTPIAGYRNPIHNPFPASLASECRKAGQIIDSFVNPKYAGLEGAIPRRILAPAKGLVICSVFKAGFLGSVRFGSGLIVCRLPDGSWSAPSAISLGGLGAGGQFGMEFTNFVFVLNTDAAVTTFINSGTLTLGGNISIAFGTGRSAETAAMIGTKGVAGIFAYSKTRGVYGGLTFEGGMIVERSSANKKLYDRKLKAKELLTGEVPPPPQAEPLMRILNSESFRLPPASQQSPATDLSPPAPPTAEAPAPEAPAAEATQTAEVSAPEAPTQQPAASGTVSELEMGPPQVPSTENSVQNAPQEAPEQPQESPVTPEHDVQPMPKGNPPKDTHGSAEDKPEITSEAHPVSVVDTQPLPPSQPEESPAVDIDDTPKEAKPSQDRD